MAFKRHLTEIGWNAGSSSEVDIGREGRAFPKLIRDDTIPSSAHTVVSTDDLLIEILLLLPVTSLILFKSVSKRWSSLIVSPSFVSRRNKISTLDSPSGFFYDLRRGIGLAPVYDFVSFDTRIPSKRSVSFLFGSEIPLTVVILDSCNGLCLCSETSHDKYYIYNPSTNLYKILPPNSIKIAGFEKLTFDPTKSTHYKVVIAGSGQVYPFQIATYSSEAGNWSVSADQFTVEHFRGFGKAVYWDGALHWINVFIAAKPFHFKLDNVNHPVLTTIKSLEALEGEVSHESRLFESGGSMILPCRDRTNSQLLNVYVMRNGYSNWSLEYFVNLDDIMRPFPQTWMISSDVRSIVLSEKEQESFMVIKVCGQALQYNFVLKTVRTLCDLRLASPRSFTRGFELIASFAGV